MFVEYVGNVFCGYWVCGWCVVYLFFNKKGFGVIEIMDINKKY